MSDLKDKLLKYWPIGAVVAGVVVVIALVFWAISALADATDGSENGTVTGQVFVYRSLFGHPIFDGNLDTRVIISGPHLKDPLDILVTDGVFSKEIPSGVYNVTYMLAPDQDLFPTESVFREARSLTVFNNGWTSASMSLRSSNLTDIFSGAAPSQATYKTYGTSDQLYWSMRYPSNYGLSQPPVVQNVQRGVVYNETNVTNITYIVQQPVPPAGKKVLSYTDPKYAPKPEPVNEQKIQEIVAKSTPVPSKGDTRNSGALPKATVIGSPVSGTGSPRPPTQTGPKANTTTVAPTATASSKQSTPLVATPTVKPNGAPQPTDTVAKAIATAAATTVAKATTASAPTAPPPTKTTVAPKPTTATKPK